MGSGRRPAGEGPAAYLRRLFGPPPAGFYRRAALHIDCGGAVQIEGCQGILLYNQNEIALDLGRWRADVFGDRLTLCGVGGRRLTLQGRVLRVEFTPKGGG